MRTLRQWSNTLEAIFLVVILPFSLLGLVATIAHFGVKVANKKRSAFLSTLELSTSKLLLDNVLPRICYVGTSRPVHYAPVLDEWAVQNQNLMLASFLSIDEPDDFSDLVAKVAMQGIVTQLITDVPLKDIVAGATQVNSMLDRACADMQKYLSLDPNDYVYATGSYLEDLLGKHGPVGVCFVFKK